MDVSNSSLPLECSETDPLGLNSRDPDDLEEGEITDHSSLPEAMDQNDMLGHGIYPDGGLASDTGATSGGTSDLQSEDMDTMAQPS